MPSGSRCIVSRGCRVVALLSLTGSLLLAADPPTTTTTRPATTRSLRDGPPPLATLDDLRLDRRMTLFDADGPLAPTSRSTLSREMVVELPTHRELIADLARPLGAAPPTVRLLPEQSRTPERFGVVIADHAIVRKSPERMPGDRDNLSDVRRDEPVWILDRSADGGAMLVHAGDGYLGWIDAAAVRAVDQPAFVAAVRGDRGVSSAARADAVIAAAKQRIGVRYVWGGKTADGIDCSGLTQTAFASIGIALPRDADQQSLVGRLVATRWCLDALLPGDLLFYVSPRRGNVHHVAIYLGDGKYLEAAGPDVHVSSMRPGDADYDGKRAATFGWARRTIE